MTIEAPRADGMLRLTCRSCGTRVRLKPEWIERRGKCPQCGASVTPLSPHDVANSLAKSVLLKVDPAHLDSETSPASDSPESPTAPLQSSAMEPPDLPVPTLASTQESEPARVETVETRKPSNDRKATAGFDPYVDWLGISTPERPPDYYGLLGVTRYSDDRDAINEEYRRRRREVKKHAMGEHAAESQDLLDQLARAVLCLTDDVRKLDYDRKMGRPADELLPATRCSVEQVLLAWDAAKADDLRRARALSEELGIPLRDAICQCSAASSEMASRALAQAEGLPFLDGELPALGSLVARVPRELVLRYRVFPVAIDQGQLIIACADPSDVAFEQPFHLALGLPVRLAIATPQSIAAAIDRYYLPRHQRKSAEEHLVFSPEKQTSLQLPSAGRKGTAPEQHPNGERKSRKQACVDSTRRTAGSVFSTIFWTSVERIVRRPWRWAPVIIGLALGIVMVARLLPARLSPAPRPSETQQQPVLSPYPSVPAPIQSNPPTPATEPGNKASWSPIEQIVSELPRTK